MKIGAHVLLKNEARFAWYSIMSILPYVDRIRIWDTGSTDETLEIISEIQKTEIAKKKDLFQVVKYENIDFSESRYRQEMLNSENDNDYEFPAIREMMLEQTSSPWFIVLDADEIWWDDSIKNVVGTIRTSGNNYESIVVPTINVVGDMFHHQEKAAGRYHLAGRVGHYNLRAINRKIPGLHGEGEHGVFRWADGNGMKIESRSSDKIKYLDAPYLHATHLRRSGNRRGDDQVYKRSRKLKYELGIPFASDFYYPEVFFRPRPDIVKSPWNSTTLGYKFIAMIETPLKKFKRRFLMKGAPDGY